jgi:hypothetical protein
VTDQEARELQSEVGKLADTGTKVANLAKALWGLGASLMVAAFIVGVWVANNQSTKEQQAEQLTKLNEIVVQQQADIRQIRDTYFRRDDIARLVAEIFRNLE